VKKETIKERYKIIEQIETYEDIINGIQKEVDYKKAQAQYEDVELSVSGSVENEILTLTIDEYENVLKTLLKQYENRIKKLEEDLK
jgi:hypothetical protein